MITIETREGKLETNNARLAIKFLEQLESEEVPVKKKYKKRKKSITHVSWLREEDEFIIDNILKKAGDVARAPELQRHTKCAIRTRHNDFKHKLLDNVT